MSPKIFMRSLPALFLVALTGDLAAQPRAADCFFAANFEGTDALAGWDIGGQVDMQDADGTPLGTATDAWRIGNASSANAGGYFPVPDEPAANHFVMANDDATPCNCGMSAVSLTSPAMDLTDRSGVALECRVFNEGALGAGAATVEANINGGSWIALATIPAMSGEWQHLFIDLSAFDGQPDVRIRFNWSDGGTWSSGFAVDDICLRERLVNDLSVVRVFIGDPSVSAIATSVQSLSYRQLPIAQFDSLVFGMEIMNRGTAVATVDELSAQLFWNTTLLEGTTSTGPGTLAPGASAIVQFSSAFVPPGIGTLDVTGYIPSELPDEDITDNEGTTSIEFTGPGWDAEYGAMAIDNGSKDGHFGSTGGFVLANRMEIMREGSFARGVSVVLSSSSTIGEEIRAILLDANLSFLDSSSRHVITQEDLENGWLGIPHYLPLTEQPSLAIADHFVGIQHLVSGDDGYVEFPLSSGATPGASLLLEGPTFDLSYLHSVPLVRLHLDALGVGLDEPKAFTELVTYPVPADAQMNIAFHLAAAGATEISLVDATGRTVLDHSLGLRPAGSGSCTLNTSAMASGMYTLVVTTNGLRSSGRVLVVH